jgi:hypothetical protein
MLRTVILWLLIELISIEFYISFPKRFIISSWSGTRQATVLQQKAL